MTAQLDKSRQHRFAVDRTSALAACVFAAMLLIAAPAAQAAISWDGGGNTNWWFNPVNWSQDAGCATAGAVCFLPPAQDNSAAPGTPVNIDAQINVGSGAWDITGEGVVYDPVNDPFFDAAASLEYPTGSGLATGSILMRDYGPQTLYRLYVSRNTTNSNTLTIKSGDLAIESTTIIGRSGSTAEAGNLGAVVQTGGIVRFPLIGVDLGQRETSGWGNGVWDYRGGTLEVSEEGSGALRLSHGSTTSGVGAGGHGRMIIHNPATGGHIRAWNVMTASYAGNGTDGVFDSLDPDGITTGVGTFEFHFANGNTRPMQVINNLSINNGLDATTGGTRSSRLDLRLDEAPSAPGGIPQNLGLFDVDSDNNGTGVIQGIGSLGGTFSSADGAVNYAEGAMVSAVFGATKYNWTISYGGNIAWAADQQEDSVIDTILDTGGTDIVLVGLSTEAVAGLLGDYNNNGAVDAADYVLWRNGGPLQNESASIGMVDQADYDFWRSQFGQTLGAGSALAAAAVPEPAAILLALLAAVAMLLHCCRHAPRAVAVRPIAPRQQTRLAAR